MKTYHITYLLLALPIIAGCAATANIKLGANNANIPSATLVAPVAQELVAYDNRKLPSQPLANRSISYEIPAGRHELVFRYVDMLRDEYGNARVVRGEFMTAAVEFKAGQSYELLFPAPSNLEQGLKYAKSPSLSIVETATGTEFAAQPQGFREGMVEVFGQFFAKSDTCKEIDISKCADSGDSGTLQRLKQAWQNATPDDKRKFQEFIKTSP